MPINRTMKYEDGEEHRIKETKRKIPSSISAHTCIDRDCHIDVYYIIRLDDETMGMI